MSGSSREKDVVAAWTLVLASVLACVAPTGAPAQQPPVVLRAATVLDGLGATLRDRDVVMRDGRIDEIVPAGQGTSRAEDAVLYDLGDLTLLPGLIDTHVHIGWHFDRTGRTPSRAVKETPEEAILYGAENAWLTELADAGADVIKIFASASIRVGGTPTLSPEQLRAACGEATARGLRTVVHAHGPESAQRSAEAGCTTIEHGALLDRETLEILADRDMFYDPNIDLIFRNYFEHKERFLGVGNYTEEGFEQMRLAVPRALDTFKEALTVPGLRIVFGTDAVAGSHGRNSGELVLRPRA